MMPKEDGLRSCVAVSNPFDEMLIEDWPFPQLFRNTSDTMLAYADNVYEVGEGDPWIVGKSFALFDLNSPTAPKAIIPNGVWHIAELPLGWILTNGLSSIFKLSHETMFSGEQVVYAQDDIAFNSCCYFKGRVVYGGFAPSNFFSKMKDLLGDLLSDLPFSANVDFDSDLKNMVYWTTIGGGDILLPFAPELVGAGLISEDVPSDVDESFFMELLKRNELGFMPMPWKGEVFVVKELGNGVVAYGENGIAALIPVSEPYPTFGLRLISNQGIAGRDAVGGDWSRHLFIDRAGNSWMLDASFNLRKLDYKEYIGNIQDEIAISYDAEEENFYISGSDVCYVLTPQGLGESPQFVTSCLRTDDELVGVFSMHRETEAIGVTDVIDFGFRDIKTVTTIEIGASSDFDFWVAADYRHQTSDPWTRSAWVHVNQRGFARIQKTANEFRIAVKCFDYHDLEIDYISVRYQPSGKRTIRGVYASSANAQSGDSSLG